MPEKLPATTKQHEDFITNPYFLSFAASVIISYILEVVFYIMVCHPPRHAIVLLGLPRAGKSVIFGQLAYSKYRHPGTYPNESIDRYFCMGRQWRIVDTPGQVKFKYVYFNYYKKWTKGIIFVIDLMTIYDERYQVAQYLYKIVSDPIIRRNKVPLLILCNRHDDLPMIDLKSIGRFLEKHIDLYKVYFSEKSEKYSVSENDYGIYRFNVPIDPFYFSSCPFTVDFASCSNFTDDSDASDLEETVEWITKI